MFGVLNTPALEEIFVALREPWVSSVFQKLLGRMMLVMSVSSWGAIWLALGMVIWSINRQTQIRPSASQSVDRLADGSQKKTTVSRQKSQRLKSENEDDFYIHDWNRMKSRINLFDSEDETSEVDEGSDSDDSEFETSETPPPSLSGNDPAKKNVSRDLIRILSKVKVFSYLSDDAFMKIIDLVEYVDLPKKGMTLIGRSHGPKEEQASQRKGKTFLKPRIQLLYEISKDSENES